MIARESVVAKEGSIFFEEKKQKLLLEWIGTHQSTDWWAKF